LSVYLDASVLLPILVAEPTSKAAERFLSDADDGLLVSAFAAAEVASAISRLVRTDALESGFAANRLAEFDIWRESRTLAVEIEGSDVRSAGMIVRRFDLMLRTPDALHIAVCRRLDARLATLDVRLAKAAVTLGVQIAPIG
jgi:predicted nucleic acid-binding protein